jgi:glycine/D-amino acid oxidase-like deaminating enzyme
MKKIAIIGAGFSGLALAFHLLKLSKSRVVLFDAGGIGSGASGVASGLLHPYPGEEARLSWRGMEGIAATKTLLRVAEQHTSEPVCKENGIIRYPISVKQKEALMKHGEDVEQIGGNALLIRSGITVHARNYLEGLWAACSQLGAELVQEHIGSLEQLAGYDQIALTAGQGIFSFPECAPLKLKAVKGQLLKCALPTPLERSMIGKGYIALSPSPEHCYVGATYERVFTDNAPCMERAKQELFPKIESFFPAAKELVPLECLAGIRVTNGRGHYTPLVGSLGKGRFVMTAMGSRGLLYHAFLGELLAKAMVSENLDWIPKEVRV